MFNRIREIRTKKGVSQEALAKASGVSRVTISKLESGKTTVTTTETMSRIADALGCTIIDIFF